MVNPGRLSCHLYSFGNEMSPHDVLLAGVPSQVFPSPASSVPSISETRAAIIDVNHRSPRRIGRLEFVEYQLRALNA